MRCLPACLPAYPSVCLSVYLAYPSACLARACFSPSFFTSDCLPVCLPIHLYPFLPECQSTPQPACLRARHSDGTPFWLSVSLCVCLPAYPPGCHSVRPSACLHIYPTICLYTSHPCVSACLFRSVCLPISLVACLPAGQPAYPLTYQASSFLFVYLLGYAWVYLSTDLSACLSARQPLTCLA